MKYHNKIYSVQFIKASKEGNLIISERMKKRKALHAIASKTKPFFLSR